jgi:hypothetical protein
MMRQAILAGVVVCAAVEPALAQAPALGDVAKHSAERRKSSAVPKKAYTNKDMPASAIRDGSTQGPAPSAASPTTSSPLPKAEDERDESWWRARMAALREGVRRNEAFQEALQSRLNALAADMMGRDDPYQRAKLGEDRGRAASEMARVTSEIAAGKKAIEDAEEEARRAGVPPGWLR